MKQPYIIITILVILILILFNYNDMTENFITYYNLGYDQRYCKSCDDKSILNCGSCNNCGICVQGNISKCVSGDIDGPENNNDKCNQWIYGSNYINKYNSYTIPDSYSIPNYYTPYYYDMFYPPYYYDGLYYGGGSGNSSNRIYNHRNKQHVVRNKLKDMRNKSKDMINKPKDVVNKLKDMKNEIINNRNNGRGKR